MNKIQRIILASLILIFLSSGCQHTMQSKNAKQNLHQGQLIEQTTSPEDSFSTVLPEAANTHEKTYLTETPPDLKDAVEANKIADQNGDKQKSPAPQTGIDHALAMCQSAQVFWEKGELENALQELDMAYASILDLDIDSFPEFNQQKEDIRYMISKRILEIYASRNVVVNGEHDAIPITINRYVQKEIDRFTGYEKRFFIRSMQRAGRYRSYIVSEFKKAGLPEELSWLPLIESGFKIRAFSPARALGLWQFIPSTGYKFGLKRNYYIDERLDPAKATKAAIAYLKALHNIFGDWATVLAAYNCGEGRVLRIIKKQNINYLDNFWDLYEKLPRETSRYVPRFLATIHIIKNLDKYNIKIENALNPMEFKIFTINKQIRLADIAKEIKVSPKILKNLNPELRYALLPPEEYKIRIPASKAETFMATLDKIKSSYSSPTRYAYHRIRPGETLSVIAKKYHTNIRAISAANGLFRKNIIVAGKILKIPSQGAGPIQRKGSNSTGKSVRYSVKKGDNLWIIARRHNTTTNRIMSANSLANSALYIGQHLTIPSGKKAIPAMKATKYWVKSGDNPFTIAKKYNMTLHRLLSLNNLTKRSKIYPGQQLLVE
ncbi:MAG: LysM peptidoglycan-binding domain-containing protein [Thermodesulfobacteriota bacterium]|nr:LysM peptidoglycan-binding domain-containing protein [Thermodesulfobacteriota bacterium]